ncbi:unnamed protein product [Urochloa decumbens]|uniref:UspA domain-containing protein n=1 Tax=Urochloa decumbens TaxID=240449 RepID=A0ABC8X0P2_9POAL
MKVVVALDDSDFSRHALAWALDHLFPAAGADADQPAPRPELVLVHALEPLRHIMYPVGPGSAVYGAPSMMESVRAAQAENARALLDRAKRACHQRGVSADAAVVEGEPREALCRAAADMGAGLLVVGSRGLGAIKRYVTWPRVSQPRLGDAGPQFWFSRPVVSCTVSVCAQGVPGERERLLRAPRRLPDHGGQAASRRRRRSRPPGDDEQLIAGQREKKRAGELRIVVGPFLLSVPAPDGSIIRAVPFVSMDGCLRV